MKSFVNVAFATTQDITALMNKGSEAHKTRFFGKDIAPTMASDELAKALRTSPLKFDWYSAGRDLGIANLEIANVATPPIKGLAAYDAISVAKDMSKATGLDFYAFPNSNGSGLVLSFSVLFKNRTLAKLNNSTTKLERIRDTIQNKVLNPSLVAE